MHQSAFRAGWRFEQDLERNWDRIGLRQIHIHNFLILELEWGLIVLGIGFAIGMERDQRILKGRTFEVEWVAWWRDFYVWSSLKFTNEIL